MTVEQLKKPGLKLFGQRSLARDITLIIVVAVILVSALSMAANLFLVARENGQQFEQKSADYLSFLKESLEIPLWNFDTAAISKLGEMMMANEIVASLSVKDFRGVINFDALKKGEVVSVIKSTNIEHQGRFLGTLELGLSKRQYQQQQNRILRIGIITIFVVILGVFWVVTFSVKRFLRKPLDDFALRIKAIAKGDYAYEDWPASHIELEGIKERFNRMAATIKNREESLVDTNQALRLEISERETAERLLRESEQRYRSLNNNIPVGVFRSKPSGEIISFNPAMVHMLNISGDAAEIAINAADLYRRPEERQRFWEDISHGRRVRGFECEMKDARGESVWVSISAQGVEDENGHIKYIDGVVEDISERKGIMQEKEKLQNQLLQLQKMEAIGTLAGGIAHDFNNILGGIIGYCELALDELKGGKSQSINYITRVLEAGNRARDLVGQILNFSRQGKSDHAVLALAPLVKECVKLLGSVLPKTIAIDTRIGKIDSTVLADATQLHQVIMNLGTNAYHAMRDEGGRLTIQLENVKLETSRHFFGNDHPAGRLCQTECGRHRQGDSCGYPRQNFRSLLYHKEG